jgi:ribosomal protein L11 methyltransferase
MAEWKKSYKPFPLAGGIWVVPSWCEVPEECAKPIRIDPGMAFGTGTHATTRLCSEILVNRLKSVNTSQISLVDVGTGTGILVMLARLFGVRTLLATDVDSQACVVARENLELNGIDDVLVTSDDVSQVKESFDFVVANIVDGVLIKLKPHLLRLLKPGGSLVLSGILKEREEIFETQFIKSDSFNVVQKLESDEWLAYELRRA